MTVSAGTRSAAPDIVLLSAALSSPRPVERRERADLERSAAQALEQLHPALGRQATPNAAPGVATVIVSKPARTPSSTALAHGHQPNPSSTTSRLRPLRGRPIADDDGSARSMPGRSGRARWPIAITTSSKPARSSAPTGVPSRMSMLEAAA